MKTPIYAVLLFLFVWVSCSKYDLNIEPAAETRDISDIKASSLLSEENLMAVKKTLTDYVQPKGAVAARGGSTDKGATFFIPLGNRVSLVHIRPFEQTIIIFEAELDFNDFYRENNDGSVSVHINSNNALTSFISPSIGFLSGENVHFSTNYTGDVSELPVYNEDGDLLYDMEKMDTNRPIKTLSIHANGKLQHNGTGAIYNLIFSNVPNKKGEIMYEYSLKELIAKTLKQTSVEKP
ncbi:MAG TPA: hypothetical protein VJ945_04695 [Flavobacteriaceae bacterium]|nr:hypothetical protein [Flavobacteriaceae bacterium]